MVMPERLKELAGEVTENQLATMIRKSASQIWLAGLGAFSMAQHEDSKMFGALVAEGEKVKERAKVAADERQAGLREKATGTWDKLEHGADDYIVKPLNLRETLLGIENVLRRYAAPLVPSEEAGQPSAPSTRAFDHCVLDLVKRELRSSDGELIDLTETEFRLLALFVENPARVLSRDKILRAVQGREWSPLDRTVDGHVTRLRRKLEGSPDQPRIIKSVRSVGYVFAREVSSR